MTFVSGGSTADGAKVQIWTYGNYANEHYALIPTGSGYFRIALAHSDKAIEVVGNSTANGVLVDQWSWNVVKFEQLPEHPAASPAQHSHLIVISPFNRLDFPKSIFCIALPVNILYIAANAFTCYN